MTGGTELFWTAIGAIAQAIQAAVVLASAIVIVYEVKRMRRESIENRVFGLKLAIDILDSVEFTKVTEAALTGRGVRGANWRTLLERINLVALMVDQKFTELDLLLKLKGLQLATLDQSIQQDAPAQLKSELTYTPALILLKRAREFADERKLSPT